MMGILADEGMPALFGSERPKIKAHDMIYESD